MAMHVESLEALIKVVEEVGARIPDRVLGDSDLGRVTTKSSLGDVVSELDRELEELLAARLRQLLPNSNFVGEERSNLIENDLAWVVDPIDGSTNVLHGLQHCAISVALCEDLIPVLGVVHNPFDGKTYYASRGGGAYMRAIGRVRDSRLKVSSTSQLGRCLLGFGLPYDRSKSGEIFRVAKALFERTQDLRRRGSASLDLVSVASGELDAHFELDLRVWDVAAAGLIVEESGGTMTTWRNQFVQWDSSADKVPLLVSNGRVHQALLDVLSTLNE